MGLKHLVILGAGSTIATIPNGDKNGEKAYTLSNLLQDPAFASFVKVAQQKGYRTDDVENLCKRLYQEDRELYNEFEALVRAKYARLELPEDFTILDRLVLSLKADDAIVSFNWDDLIIQAYQRMSIFVPDKQLPILAFPHGNAQAVYNKKHCTSKRIVTGNYWMDSPLNMPIDETEYKSDLFIKSQWHILDFYMRNAQMVTLFGYSAPASDEQDLLHLRELFEKNQICDKIEIIDDGIKNAERVAENIKDFRMQDNWLYLCGDFWHSTIAKLPRRTLSALVNYNYTSQEGVQEETLAEFMGHVGPLMDEELND